jgi:hypothetical protein
MHLEVLGGSIGSLAYQSCVPGRLHVLPYCASQRCDSYSADEAESKERQEC